MDDSKAADPFNDSKRDESPAARLSEISSGSGPWLNAWYDPMAHLKTTSARIATVDITNDGNHALLVVDDSKRLKVFRGMNLISSHKLLDHASCLSVFHPPSASISAKQENDSNSTCSGSGSLPAIAVGTGSNIYIYRSMRPYFKFSLPTMRVNAEELRIWNECRSGELSSEQGLDELLELQARELEKEKERDNKSKSANNLKADALTFRSMFILSMTARTDQLKAFTSYVSTPLARATSITAMSSIQRGDTESSAASSLVLGTESGELHFLDARGATISASLQLPSVPCALSVMGLLSVDYRVVVATRAAMIFTVRNGKLLGNYIQCESAVAAMCAFKQNIIVATLSRTLSAYHIKGNNVKLWSLYFDSAITCLEPMRGTKFAGNNNNFFLCGFRDGRVAMYNNNVQIHLLADHGGSQSQSHSPITALRFGKYGREDATLIILNESGCLNVKIMSRRVDVKSLEARHAERAKKRCHIQQEIPLSLPPVTQLFLDQELREKSEAPQMHKIWQREVVQFRLALNRHFLSVLSKGASPFSSNSSAGASHQSATSGRHLLLNVRVLGVGPAFQLEVELKNTDKRRPCRHIVVVLRADRTFYSVERSVLRVPLLVPLLCYRYRMAVRCVEPNGNSSPIRLAICNERPSGQVQFMTAIVDMPLADVSP